ncbi:CpeT protein [Chryseobacterium sp. SLBN-27]|uniref:chromophore lyase CpcT/CpeT n=1 Tax=Chryseobacterium sp. SLBN-27 TaxID=3042287 RepID=UPI002866E154|nr:chromophore lyase CpcT/CpeT [Chryseobacterium sp. SLBN-27]MDR6159962.1 CpeT protein [Chryseobacterium sp. SLBN-27]
MKKSLISFFAVLAIAGCTTSHKTTSAKQTDKELENLVSLMDGKFSSELQSKTDSTYYNISLVMIPIWSERNDGKWLYVEQAVAANSDKPYRQRVYHLQHPSKDTFTSEIYTIKDALTFAGLQNDKMKKDKLTFDLIELKDGCTVTLKKQGETYVGGTEADKCPSDLRGAAYATTKIVLKKGMLESWDQGFDASGKQVWGATKRGYIFMKQ